MKVLQKICLVLLLTTFSSVYGGDCFKDEDVDDCRVKAEQGDALAQGMLGFMYYYGTGVLYDGKEAVKWWMKSAEQGDTSSLGMLGQMYLKGQGVVQDYVMAYMYFSIEAFIKIKDSDITGMTDAIKNRGRVEKDMTSSQIAEAEKLAREWVQKHQ
jgi:uncharacterized protein